MLSKYFKENKKKKKEEKHIALWVQPVPPTPGQTFQIQVTMHSPSLIHFHT